VKLLLNVSAIQEPITGEKVYLHLFFQRSSSSPYSRFARNTAPNATKKQVKKQKQAKKQHECCSDRNRSKSFLMKSAAYFVLDSSI